MMRTSIVTVTLGVVVAIAATTPAGGHESDSITHNWQHTRALAKALFYTKAKSDDRFVNVGEVASDAQLLDGIDSTAFAPATHAHAGADIASGTVAEARIDDLIARVADVFAIVLGNDGVGSGLNADLLDGMSSAAFAQATHAHAGEDVTSGTVAEPRIDDLIARVADVFAIVLANDGIGSGLNADLLDGMSAADFAAAAHTHTLDAEDRRRTIQWFIQTADPLAASVTSEQVVFTAPDAITITGIIIEPGGALTANDSNFATIVVARRDADGSNKATVGSVTTRTTGTGSWAPFAVEDLGALSNTALADGQKLTIEITKAGLGVIVPPLLVQVEYTVD